MTGNNILAEIQSILLKDYYEEKRMDEEEKDVLIDFMAKELISEIDQIDCEEIFDPIEDRFEILDL